MSRHDRDAVSLMGGLLLVLIALGVLVDDLTGLRVQAEWAGPVLLVAVGLAGLVASLRRGATPGEAPALPGDGAADPRDD